MGFYITGSFEEFSCMVPGCNVNERYYHRFKTEGSGETRAIKVGWCIELPNIILCPKHNEQSGEQ